MERLNDFLKLIDILENNLKIYESKKYGESQNYKNFKDWFYHIKKTYSDLKASNNFTDDIIVNNENYKTNLNNFNSLLLESIKNHKPINSKDIKVDEIEKYKKEFENVDFKKFDLKKVDFKNSKKINKLGNLFKNKLKNVAIQKNEISILKNLIKEKDEIIKEKNKTIRDKDEIIKENFKIIKERNEEIKNKKEEINRLKKKNNLNNLTKTNISYKKNIIIIIKKIKVLLLKKNILKKNN